MLQAETSRGGQRVVRGIRNERWEKLQRYEEGRRLKSASKQNVTLHFSSISINPSRNFGK